MNRMKVAFLDAVFPGLTTTFLNREFAYLKERSSIDIFPIAMKRPRKEWLNKEFEKYSEITKYLRPDSLIGIIAINIFAVLSGPIRYARVYKGVFKNWKDATPRYLAQVFFHTMCGIYLSYYLKKNKFDTIHAHFDTASTIAFVANRFSSIPFSFTVHANEIYSGALLLSEKVKYARMVIADCYYNVDHINLLTNYRFSDKIHVIYNAIDTKSYISSQVKKEASKPFRLLSIGSFTGFKGYPTVLKALCKLKKEGYEFRYSIIGAGRKCEEEMIRKMVSDFDLEKSVELLGLQPFNVLREKNAETDVFVMASEIFDRGIRDGIPTVISEAMLMKRPVISTYISDIPYNIIHGKTGYLFPEKQYESLARLLEFVYNNYNDAIEVAERAYTFAMERFDAETNHKQLEKYLIF